jgi:GNAT superfamily N-acetyltransferase
MISIRQVASAADLDAYVRVWNAITPDEPTTAELQRERLERFPGRLYLMAELDGEPVGSGFAGGSDSPGRAALAPRVLPHARRRGIGAGLLRELAAHAGRHGYTLVSAQVAGDDPGSLAFAQRFGFEEVDRQVEQVKALGDELPGEPPPGVTFVTVAERPELLREAYELASEGYADFATWVPVEISLEEWLGEEATIPEGSFVALAGEEIVGFSGLCRDNRATAATAVDGLTVVRRAWRRRGLAAALKRAELAWAAAHGIREILTWTQRGNEGMRTLNEQLGYVTRAEVLSLQSALPLPPGP